MALLSDHTRERILHTLQIAQLLRHQGDLLGDSAIGKNPTDTKQLDLANRCQAQANALLESALTEIETIK